jgi:plastocyanin
VLCHDSNVTRPWWPWIAAACTVVVLTVWLPAIETRAAAAAPGTVTGRVTVAARMRGVPIATNAYSPRAVTQQATPTTPELRNVVVYLKDAAFAGPLPVTRTQIRQERESFSPRVVAITRGSTVEFPNFDPYFHNVFSLSGTATFDLGRYPDGQSRERQFTKAGVVKVYCHIHSQMSATVLVLDHPYFTSPDADGQFSVGGVPPGDYTLVGWHERVGEYTTRITVTSGHTTSAEISLPMIDAR